LLREAVSFVPGHKIGEEASSSSMRRSAGESPLRVADAVAREEDCLRVE
jgi:hypothetical protein